MTKKTAKRKPAAGQHRTPVTGMRLPRLTIRRLDRIQEALDVDRTGATNVAAYLACRELGLLREDIAASIDSLERVHGPDGLLIAIVEQYEEADDGVTAYVAVAAADADTPAGADLQELEDWSGMLNPVVKVGPTTAATLVVTHDPSGVMFKFGVLTNPVVRNALAARIRDLPELVLAPEQEDPLKLRREIRDSLELARKLTTSPDKQEEAPLD